MVDSALTTMTYLFTGQDYKLKEEKITQLKRKILTSKEAVEFDYELLYAQKLDPHTLKKALLSLPVILEKRFVLIRDIDKLSSHNTELLINFISQPQDKIVILLETHKSDQNLSLIKKFKPFVKIIDFPQSYQEGVFDMTRAMERGNKVEALKIFHQLFSSGVHPLQVMGPLIWHWGKLKNKISIQRFKKGLVALRETDFNIKRSRLRPEYAMEVLIIQLSALQEGLDLVTP